MVEESYKVTKTTVECYKFRSTNGFGWADITIDAEPKGEQGRVSIASDFGSWQNYWGSCGIDFKSFISELDIHYAAGKFGCDKEFDGNATINQMTDDAKAAFAHNRTKYKLAQEEIKSLCDYTAHKDEFCHEVANCETIMSMYDGFPSICYCIDHGFKHFWDEVMPLLRDEFRKEQEATQTTITA